MDYDENNNNLYELEIDLPMFVELKNSQTTSNDYGTFSRICLKSDQFIGSFKGKIRKSMSQCTDPAYVWTIFSSRNVPLFYIDGSDPRESNWLRFIRTTNDSNKQNIICMQQNQQINYFTSKDIHPGDELLTYLPEKKKKPKKSNTKSDDLSVGTSTVITTRTRYNLQSNNNTSKVNTQFQTTSSPVRTWTCQLCKKQFDQRIDLSKHQCIEHNLKMLKKKKELRKKRWREQHWKRKIDLSYIETTSLTQSSQNIADNLSFCIDGTHEDLRAYSKEVKDYLNSELGTETQVQMFLKCCFPDVFKRLAAVPSALFNIDANLVNKSNSYFIDIIYTPNKPIESSDNNNNNNNNNNNDNINDCSLAKSKFRLLNSTLNTQIYNCKNCKLKCFSMTELIKHHRDVHNLILKTTFDCFNRFNDDTIAYWSTTSETPNSPVGYFGCDPFAYVFNLHWDQTVEFKCSICNEIFSRPKFSKHVIDCQIENDKKQELNNQNDTNSNSIDTQILIDNKKPYENYLLICYQAIDNIITKIEENDQNETLLNKKLSQIKSKILNEQAFLIPPPIRVKRPYKKKSESNKLVNNLLSSSSADETSRTLDENYELVVKKPKLRDPNIPRKIFECEKCSLEFTSSNSVIRHQEKSCLRVKVINLTSELKIDDETHIINKKKCPICSAIFFNTHRLSIHIYKHHGSLLGSAGLPPATEALYPDQFTNNNQINITITNNNSNNSKDRLINEDADVDIVYYE